MAPAAQEEKSRCAGKLASISHNKCPQRAELQPVPKCSSSFDRTHTIDHCAVLHMLWVSSAHVPDTDPELIGRGGEPDRPYFAPRRIDFRTRHRINSCSQNGMECSYSTTEEDYGGGSRSVYVGRSRIPLRVMRWV